MGSGKHHARKLTISCLPEAHAHASIGNSNIIIPSVGLLELLHILQLVSERQENLHQNLCRLQVHPPENKQNQLLI